MKAKIESQKYPLKDGSIVILREANPSDAKTILQFIHQVAAESDFLSFGVDEFKMTEDEEVDFLRKCHEANNQIYILATLQDQIIGTLHFATGHRARVHHSGEFGIVIKKAYWGLGIGGILLDALIDWAKQTGFVRKINLKVRSNNHRGIALYKRKDFIHEGTLTNEIRIDGQFYDLYTMGLNL